MTNDHSSHMQRAIDLAVTNVTSGGGPFGAVVVKDDIVIATGENRVTLDNDPSAHAEVTAIRRACAALNSFSLEGTTLYSSCEPCPMCASAALWARVDSIVFAADRHDAALGGFDDSRFWSLIKKDFAEWDVPVKTDRLATYNDPFVAWKSRADRTEY